MGREFSVSASKLQGDGTVLKMKYELTCDGCGKTEIMVEIPASFDLDWQPLQPVRPHGWKEIGDAHFCPSHNVGVRVYDDERDGKVYYDAPKSEYSIIR